MAERGADFLVADFAVLTVLWKQGRGFWCWWIVTNTCIFVSWRYIAASSRREDLRRLRGLRHPSFLPESLILLTLITNLPHIRKSSTVHPSDILYKSIRLPARTYHRIPEIRTHPQVRLTYNNNQYNTIRWPPGMGVPLWGLAERIFSSKMKWKRKRRKKKKQVSGKFKSSFRL